MNAVKTVLLLGVLSGLLLFAGEMLGGRTGLEWGLAMAVAMNFFSYFFSERLALMSYNAQPVTPEENAEVYARVYPLVYNLTRNMGLPMPKLWLIPEDSPNAFATGRNPHHASVAFTAGILRLMNDRELEGVVAHELGHVLHRDILISSVAATLASALTFLARMAFWFGPRGNDEEERGNAWAGLLMMIVAPLAALLIQMAISRTREFSADAASAKYTHSPDGLISALRKLEIGIARNPMTDASPSTAHLFILNPFGRGGLMKLFSTHPSTEERIARLEAMRYAPVR
ncbi:MAG TPA: zinc metalloprotease HtpX [Bryobacteraceae bacterium]|jgi:heat shock protein HtpX|nr:zinc metalloprotease HtpX [Bryobacteraceae bacterium]